MDYQSAQELFDALSAPFPTEEIDWRVGSTNPDKTKGRALAYIDARTAMDRLDAVCGMDGWQCSYKSHGSMMECSIGIRTPQGEWIWKSDGAGQTDVEGEKGMMSDAFKRAAVKFGVGRYLYGMDAPQVALEAWGKSYKIADREKDALAEKHDKFAQRIGWGNPAEVAVYKLLVRIVQETVTQPGDVVAFREAHKGMIPQLRVAMRRHLDQVLDQIGGTQREAAE